MFLDLETLQAALLHDVIEDCDVTKEDLDAHFGSSVAELVDGVSKLDKLKFRDRKEAPAENFRKMVLAMVRDILVILIKLADRTQNMRTLGALRPDKKRRIARETLEIYAPSPIVWVSITSKPSSKSSALKRSTKSLSRP